MSGYGQLIANRRFPLQLAELAYVIDPKSIADSKITENHSPNTLFTAHFHPERTK
jgi:hypothetical protein